MKSRGVGVRLKDFWHQNCKYIILAGLMTGLSFTMIVGHVVAKGIAPFSKRAIFTYGFFAFLTVVMGWILYRAKQKKWKIEKVFLTCGLILGAFYSLTFVVSGAPDEPAHFWRAYGLAEGKIFPDEDGNFYYPANLAVMGQSHYLEGGYAEEIRNFSVMASDEKKSMSSTVDTYTPFSYWPHIIGVWVGKILRMPLLPMMLLCRLFGMVACIFIVYLCIKYVPVMKKLFFLIALLPMSMQCFCAISADGLTICAGMALVAYVFYARKMERRLGWKDVLLVLWICLTLVLTKPVYAPLCLLLFWIPKKKFKTNARKLMTIGAWGGVVIAMFLIKTKFSAELPHGANDSFGVKDALMNPIGFLAKVGRSLLGQIDGLIRQMVGESLGWLSIDLYIPYVIVTLVIFAYLCGEREMKIPRSLKIFAVGCFGLVVLALYLSMAVIWSDPKNSVIYGMQGRYFLPALLLIPIACLPSKKMRRREMVALGCLYTFTILFNVYAISIVVETFI